MKRRPLTPRQADCLDAIREAIERDGRPPSRRELCVAMGVTSCNGVQEHLERLERKGWISVDPLKSRAITVLADQPRSIEVSIYRSIGWRP